ncbi:hypothetical protein DTW90_35075 [Neorhizobium sp. P12A]|jgi:hypothetical protein|uniref:hypothetical protein n=1 Tax=Rhizobium/Agrobacterium group TaxID=227290 RepID=UPI00104F06B4|nr:MULTISPECIES: hypothetical protein [Rhizobium/Agrobacterium group]KAA0685684.1 hypothetical protein DTW90_35075 [Neorhizobium sp. P12A]TCR71464.1 hypothetical protein EV561_13334 [Rhizobium sp. BK376]
MSDEAREAEGSAVHTDHFCEYPGCSKWGAHGYDVHPAGTQWFCYEHRWMDYKLGKGPRTFFEEEAAGIDAIMIEPRAIGSR